MNTPKFSTRIMTRTALLLGLTLAIQALRLQPVITGPLVNFMLVLSTLLVGQAAGVFIGFVTPFIALSVGILPAPLAPAIPFIMLGNALLCLAAGFAINRSINLKLAAVVLGAFIKFAVIAGAVSYALSLPPQLAKALMLPQLFTALIGGLLAVVSWQAIARIIPFRQE